MRLFSHTGLHACTHCPVPGDTMSKLDPAGVKGHIFFREGSGNQALLHKHSDFNNTTAHTCSATTSISPFLLGDFTVRGWEKSAGCVYVPLLGLSQTRVVCGIVLIVCWRAAWFMLWLHALHSFLVFCFSFGLVLSPPFLENQTQVRLKGLRNRNVLIFIALNKVCSL